MNRLVQIPTNSKNLVRDYVTAVNGILKLTEREIEVIAAFIRYDKSLAAAPAARKYVAEELEMKSVAVLNNFVKALKDKGVILPVGDQKNRYTYHPIIRDITDEVTIQIRFAGS
jgi:hypothetical protein